MVFFLCSCISDQGENNNMLTAKDLSGNDATLHTCELCGQEALTESDMRTHLLLEHIEGSVSCPFCDLANVSLDEMNQHIDSQHREQLKSPQRQSSASKTSEWTADKQFQHLHARYLDTKENADPNSKVCHSICHYVYSDYF